MATVTDVQANTDNLRDFNIPSHACNLAFPTSWPSGLYYSMSMMSVLMSLGLEVGDNDELYTTFNRLSNMGCPHNFSEALLQNRRI